MLIPIGSMYAIYGNMDPINIPPMLAYIPAPWILWDMESFLIYLQHRREFLVQAAFLRPHGLSSPPRNLGAHNGGTRWYSVVHPT